MFGHDDQQQQSDEQAQTTDASVLQAAMPDPITPASPPAGFNIPANDPPAEPAPSEPEAESSAPELPAASTPDPAPSSDSDDADTPATPAGDDLVDIKQQALQHLSPLVGHLDQTPEEKFRTTMMMIQASDNQTLLKDAYEAAQKITDEKTKAQALLDVINEINYFTHQK